MKARKPRDLTRIFKEGTLIDAALTEGVLEALKRHKQLGCPVVEWRNGKTVWVAPEDIRIPEPGGAQKHGRKQVKGPR
jgi:hypothetical protein